MNLKLTISHILLNNQFSVEDFVHDDGISVFKSSRTLCESEIGRHLLPFEEDYLFKVLRQKYEANILITAEWSQDCSFLKDGNFVECKIESQKVSAIVHVTPIKISFDIVSPYEDNGWSSLSELSTFSYTTLPYYGSPANEYGIQRLKIMIIDSFYHHLYHT